MSTREMLKHDIDILPDNALSAVSEFISLIYKFSDSVSDKSDLEKGYQILIKNIKRTKSYKSVQELFNGFDGEYERIEIDWGESMGREVWD